MKKLLFTGLLVTLYSLSFAQQKNWQHLDLEKDSVYGIGTTRAYAELLQGRPAKTVIVAIVDAGIDTSHEDLKANIWTDPKTGHHGWNYIGGETGQEDVTHLATYKSDFYDSLAYTKVPEAYRAAYQQYRIAGPALDGKRGEMRNKIKQLEGIKKLADSLVKVIGKDNPTAADFKQLKLDTTGNRTAYAYGAIQIPSELVKRILRRLDLYPDWKKYYQDEIVNILAQAKYHLAHGLNPDNHEPDTAKGDFDVAPDKLGPFAQANQVAYHGTHVAGIIGAVRGNSIGMDGVADHVQLMMLKDNGNLREVRDKCVADAIRFAVDHGAKVINMSFGKPYTWDKKDVDEAVRYAAKHDVLIIHAAGNDHDNIDKEPHYPNPVFLDGTKSNNWLEVGASDPKGKLGNFGGDSGSNYGQDDVDVFAPGVAIYSTLPFNQYASWSGTSMAAPVVTGVAALIREYYPKLSAVQVKEIIMQTVNKTEDLKDKCVSGGVVDAYKALKLAATYH